MIGNWTLNDSWYILTWIHFSSEWFVICTNDFCCLKSVFEKWKRSWFQAFQDKSFLISMKKIVVYYQAQAQHLYIWSLFVTTTRMLWAWFLKSPLLATRDISRNKLKMRRYEFHEPRSEAKLCSPFWDVTWVHRIIFNFWSFYPSRFSIVKVPLELWINSVACVTLFFYQKSRCCVPVANL